MKQVKRVAFSAAVAAVLLVNRVEAQQPSASTQNENVMITAKIDSTDEAQVRRLTENFVTAFHNKDLDLMMSLFAPGFVGYDIVPPLQDIGADTYRKVWAGTFAFFKNSIEFETRDQHIVTGTDVAFSYFLLRLKTEMGNGIKVDRWQRMTFGFNKINGKWLITHEHVSVPVDFSTGKAVVDIVP
jgi:ketosteroid isomerase-like protein